MEFEKLYSLFSIRNGKGNSLLEIYEQEESLNIKLPSFVKNFYNQVGLDKRIKSDNFPHSLKQLSADKNGIIEIYHDDVSGYKRAIRPYVNDFIYCYEDKSWVNQKVRIKDFFQYMLYWRVCTSGILKFSAMGSFQNETIKAKLCKKEISLIFESFNPYRVSFYQKSKNDILAVESNTIHLAANNKDDFEKGLNLFEDKWDYISGRNFTFLNFN